MDNLNPQTSDELNKALQKAKHQAQLKQQHQAWLALVSQSVTIPPAQREVSNKNL